MEKALSFFEQFGSFPLVCLFSLFVFMLLWVPTQRRYPSREEM